MDGETSVTLSVVSGIATIVFDSIGLLLFLVPVSMVVDGKTLIGTHHSVQISWSSSGSAVILIRQNSDSEEIRIAREPIIKFACYTDAFMSTVPLMP